MFCTKCGNQYEGSPTFCVKCGVRLNPEKTPKLPVSTEARAQVYPVRSKRPWQATLCWIFMLIGGAITLVGSSAPWTTWTYPRIYNGIRLTGHGSCTLWDWVSHGEAYAHFQLQPHSYHYLVAVGVFVGLAGSLLALAFPGKRLTWAIAVIGALLVVTGTADAFQDEVQTVQIMGNANNFTKVESGVGMYLTLFGGIAAASSGVVGLLVSHFLGQRRFVELQ
jgi:hypothetical protein